MSTPNEKLIRAARNAGARAERRAIVNELRQRAAGADEAEIKMALDNVLEWINGRAKRTAARKGGVGRR
jgi:hypothetical protein